MRNVLLFITTDSAKNEIQKIGKTKRRKSLHSFHNDDTLHVEPLTGDPKSQDCMSFRVVKVKNRRPSEVTRFRAENIVHMRNFMASLGGTGVGLFSSEGSELRPVESNKGKWDAPQDDADVFVQQASGFMAAAGPVFALPANGNLQSYAEAIDQLPVEFYYNPHAGVICNPQVMRERKFPGMPLPIFNPDSCLPKCQRRLQDDTFRSPYTQNPVFLYSIGYGPEVGLPEGVQEVFDPCQNRSIILDHNEPKLIFKKSKLVLNQPGQKPAWAPQTQPQLINLGDNIQRELPPEVYNTLPSVVQDAAARAHSKPISCILSAHGLRGRDGVNGLPGSSGRDGDHGKRKSSFFGGSKRGGNGKNGTNGSHGDDGTRGVTGNRGGDVISILNGAPEDLKISGSQSVRLNLGGVQSERGQGGRGGNGGDGQDGSNSSNGNCGNGGDGGNGGGKCRRRGQRRRRWLLHNPGQ